MPKVTRYATPKVEERAPSEVYGSQSVSAESFGALEGRAMQGLGKAVERVGRRLKKAEEPNYDFVIAQNAFNESNKDDRIYMEDGVGKRTGRAATGILAEAELAFKGIADIHGKDLNPEQLEMFTKMRSNRTNKLLDKVAGYETEQFNVERVETGNAALKGFSEDAAIHYDDMEVLAGAVRSGGATIDIMMPWASPEVKAEKQAAYKSTVYLMAVERTRDNDGAAAALDVLGKVSKHMTAVDLSGLKETLEETSRRQTVSAVASESYELVRGGEDIQTVKAQIDARDDLSPVEKTNAKKQLENIRKDEDANNKRKVDAANNIHWNDIIGLKNSGASAGEMQEVLNKITDATVYKQMDKYAKLIDTEWPVWTKIKQMTDKELFEITNPMVYRGELKDGHFDELLDMIKGAKDKLEGKNSAVSRKLKAIRTPNQIVTSNLKRWEIDPLSDEGEQIFRTVEDEVFAMQEEKQRNLSPEEISGITRDVFKRYTVEETGLIPSWVPVIGGDDPRDRPAVLLEEDEPIISEEIPDKTRGMIIHKLRELGRDLDEDEVRRIYTGMKTISRGEL